MNGESLFALSTEIDGISTGLWPDSGRTVKIPTFGPQPLVSITQGVK